MKKIFNYILIFFIIIELLFIFYNMYYIYIVSIMKNQKIESLKEELNSVKFEYEYMLYCVNDSLQQ